MFAVFSVRNQGVGGEGRKKVLRIVTFLLILREETCTGIRDWRDFSIPRTDVSPQPLSCSKPRPALSAGLFIIYLHIILLCKSFPFGGNGVENRSSQKQFFFSLSHNSKFPLESLFKLLIDLSIEQELASPKKKKQENYYLT